MDIFTRRGGDITVIFDDAEQNKAVQRLYCHRINSVRAVAILDAGLLTLDRQADARPADGIAYPGQEVADVVHPAASLIELQNFLRARIDQNDSPVEAIGALRPHRDRDDRASRQAIEDHLQHVGLVVDRRGIGLKKRVRPPSSPLTGKNSPSQ